ncbi:hypothetical protein P3H15_32685 [Rhodococcus sp. T2V]|uniref:hypothetical protein n=1 Tax=Rhodococcus sp. T2V TaxID=3034164 RepID=UPI0023E2B502|nr:hypothetical protein [Rhodococcus sp. T2V]MDF3309777.1 hypothetical protein [Rhodococcus sp. T2V]
MSARDELAGVLKGAADSVTLAFQFNMKFWGPVADAVLAAGYRKPRTVTTAEELDALPFLTVIRDSDGAVHERLEWDYGPALQWTRDGAQDLHPKLPATVLYTPVEAAPR